MVMFRIRQVRVVTDMVEGGLTPDEATYAGILHACQRANEAELAFDVLRYGQAWAQALCAMLLSVARHVIGSSLAWLGRRHQ